MTSILTTRIPDLIVHVCPLGCDNECDRIWINETTGHRIICRCHCNHVKKTLGSIWEPGSNVFDKISSSQEATQENGIH